MNRTNHVDPMKFTSRLGQVSNEKKGKLKLPRYHPMHKNPFYYDDQVQEIYDANGVKKRDKVDIVRKGVEGKCSKLLMSASIPCFASGATVRVSMVRTK